MRLARAKYYELKVRQFATISITPSTDALMLMVGAFGGAEFLFRILLCEGRG